MIKKLFFCAFIITGFLLKAQAPVKKENYRFINENFESTLHYEKAMTHTDLDSLRFLNERRRIPLDGTTMYIELFSANELLERYKKPISPLTIKNPATARKVKLTFASNNYSLVVVPEKKK